MKRSNSSRFSFRRQKLAWCSFTLCSIRPRGDERPQSCGPDRRVDLPGNHKCPYGMAVYDLADVRSLADLAGAEQPVGESERGQALIDDPSVWSNSGPIQVALQFRRLMHRGGLRQRDDQYLRVVRVTESR